MLAFRISRAIDVSGPILDFNSSWYRLFEHSHIRYGHQQMKEMSIFQYIRRSTCNRPRDYVRFIKACAEDAIALNHSKISAATIVRVDKAFSNYLRSEFEDEVAGILPDVPQILDVLSAIRKQTFFPSEFVQKYQAAVRRKSVEDRDPQSVLRILFHFSIVGNQPRQRNATVFRYLNSDATYNSDEAICVHRGLFKALQIM
jgi:hypothetical protein